MLFRSTEHEDRVRLDQRAARERNDADRGALVEADAILVLGT